MPSRKIFGLTLMLLLVPVFLALTGCTVGYGYAYPARPAYGYAYGNGYYNGYYNGYAPGYYGYAYAPTYYGTYGGAYAYPRYGYGYGHVGPMYRPPVVVGPGRGGGGGPYFHGGGHGWGHR